LIYIEAHVVEIFVVVAATLSSTHLPFDEQSLQGLGMMKLAVEYFCAMRGERWKEIGSAYANVLASTRMMLRQKSRDIEATVKMLEEHGITSGRDRGNELAAFDACICYDDFFDPRDRFVLNSSAHYHNIYDQRAQKIRNEMASFFSALDDPAIDSLRDLHHLKALIQESRQISDFASTTGGDGVSVAVSDMKKCLKEYSDSLAKRTDNSIRYWDAVLKGTEPKKGRGADKVSQRSADSMYHGVEMDDKRLKKFMSATKRLDDLLGELELLVTFDLSEDVLETVTALLSDIAGGLRRYSQKIKSDFDTKRNYAQMAFHLQCLDTLGDFSHAAKHVPNLESMKQKASFVISQDAKQIESMVDATCQWDAIADLVEKFTEANVLDPYIDGQVSSRLVPSRSCNKRKKQRWIHF
jgi:hypothetical protein